MRSRIWLLALALVLPGLTGCASPSGPAPPVGSIPFHTVDQGDNSGIEEPGTVVVRSAPAWRALWENHTANQQPADDRPAVDFDERMVLAAFRGQSPDGCHGTEIANVTGQADGSIVVDVEHYVVEGAACTEQITYPFHIVEIDRYGGEVVFDERETTRQADGSDGSDGGDGNDDGEPIPGGDDGASEASYTCRERGDGAGDPADGSKVSFETVENGQVSGIEEACLTLARNQTAWEALWRDHQGEQPDPEPRPAVNFSKRMVVAIFKGQSPDGCHGAEITNLTTNGSALVVEGAFVHVEGAFCTQQVTYPFHIVETDRYDGPVRFDVENETRQA